MAEDIGSLPPFGTRPQDMSSVPTGLAGDGEVDAPPLMSLLSSDSAVEPKERFVLGKTVKPLKQHKMVYQQMNAAAEALYFWILNFMRSPNALGLEVEKTSDVYTATEASSYFGNIEARKEAQMRNVSQYMATIGGMVKSMFQMIRELRILDERMDYYEQSMAGDEAAEIALKGIWVDMVEGGAESPTSVLGLARRVGFVVLPDLFFRINPSKGSKGVDREVSALKEDINEKVLDLLKRKLFQYYVWKERTGKEHEVRKNFVLKSLKQHYHSIKMYTHWLKPYLRNIAKLQMKNIESPDLVTAFESNLIELELIGVQKGYALETEDEEHVSREFTDYFPVIRVNFRFVSRPEMAFQQEYQRGAVHSGRSEITFEGYVLTKDQLDEYRNSKDMEDLDILQSVDESVSSLGDELREYLMQAGELVGEQRPSSLASKKKGKGAAQFSKDMVNPFAAVFRGFGSIFGSLTPNLGTGSHSKKTAYELSKEKGAAAGTVIGKTYALYDVFKKAHGMLSW